MATYKAEIKTVETGGTFTVTMESGSASTARQQIEKLYDPIYIYNLRECRDGGVSFGGGDSLGWFYLIAFIFVLYIVVEYWWIVVPIGAIILIAWIYNRFFAD